MAVTLEILIKAAPFPEDHKTKLLENFNKLTEDQKYRLSQTAWYALAKWYYEKMKIGRELIFEEVANGERKLNPNDFQELEAKLTYEFAQKLQSAETEEQIAEVKQQIENFKTQPLPVDKTTSPPPARNASPARSDAASLGEHSVAGGPARNADASDAGGPTQKP